MTDAAHMSDVPAGQPPAVRSIRVPMSGRDPNEAHRAVTPLELLFDLSFVVAVAQAANALHHALAGGQVAYGLGMYFIVFFGVWACRSPISSTGARGLTEYPHHDP